MVDFRQSPATLSRLQHLDMLRGVAALLVMAGHVRAFVVTNFGAQVSPGLSLEALYAVTGLGNQAVLIFFALSGYLVGGKALLDMHDRRWSWSRYLLRRMSRLWLVLIPALVLTAAWDSAGISLGDKGYGGEFFSTYLSVPSGLVDRSPATLMGNVFFLQTIAVPVYGSNGPLWSLANEFWYYILAPLIASVVFVYSRTRSRIIPITIAAFLIWWLPFWLLAFGAIWCAGALARYVSRSTPMKRFLLNGWFVTPAIGGFVAALLWTRLSTSSEASLALGIAVALLLPALASLPSPSLLYDRLARGLAEISYTLYLTHFPLLTFLVFTFAAPHRWNAGTEALSIGIGLSMIALAWAVLVWWCFERNTDLVFRYLYGQLSRLGSRLSGAEAPIS